MKRLLVLTAAFALAASSAAPAQYYQLPPGTPPALCAGDVFVDLVGTAGADTLTAPNRATRVWGLGGDDVLFGSRTRVACLIGGRGNDSLLLPTGGGVAYGQQGRDTILGSQLGDVIDGGKDPDGVVAGAGDDKITSRDGTAEVIDCGAGGDIVKADRVDVLIACESVAVTGRPAFRLRARPATVRRYGTVRVRVKVPVAAGSGAYRFVLVSGNGGSACADGPVEVARFPGKGKRVKRGQRVRIGLAHPARGWCKGTARVALLRRPGYGFPAVPVARLSFNVR